MKFKYCNLSLYNPEELLRNLGIEGRHSDEEILIEAYKRWGENAFDKINGDFAFALLDDNKEILLAVRDPLGIKSLYYTTTENNYYFSDDIEELFSLSKIDKQPNLKSIETLLHQGYVDYEESMYEGIKRVPPGHYLIITKGEAKLFRYWYPEEIETDYTLSLENASEKFRHLFEEAILARRESDEETAYELSGGLDSSSIVSTLKTKYPSKRADTYSMRFGDLHCDEYYFIRSVEEKYDFTATSIDAAAIDYQNKFNWDFNYQMSPHWPITTTFTMYFPMMERMKQDQKKIIITGQGGDHLLTGNCYILEDLTRRVEFGKILKELTHLVHAPIRFNPVCLFTFWMTQKQKRLLKKVLSPWLKKKSVSLSTPPRDLFQLRDIASPSKREDISLLISAAESTMLDSNVLHILEGIYDIQFRHPFFDKKLVEFVLSLPPEYKYSRGWTKVLLRYSMKDILPEKIRSRRDKAEFSEILIQQLRTINIRAIMNSSSLVALDLIKHKEIDRLIDLFEANHHQELLFLWRIVNTEYWYQKTFPQK